MGLLKPPEHRPQLRVQGDRPVRQLQPSVQKGDLTPGQVRDLLPGQALQPGQPEHHGLRAGLFPLQQTAQGGLLQPLCLFPFLSHDAVPLSSGLLVMNA